jgi:hypothetical protein
VSIRETRRSTRRARSASPRARLSCTFHCTSTRVDDVLTC